MNKMVGITVGDFEIVDEHCEDGDCEEMTLGELLERGGIDELAFVRQYNAVNVHFMLSKETLPAAMNFVKDIKSDPRLEKMNAVVFLQFKDKASGNGRGRFHSIAEVPMYQSLVDYCQEMKVNYGFDSCSAPLFMMSSRDESLVQFAEPCESGLFSSYINCEGQFFPCSFCEGEGKWKEGLDAMNSGDFVRDIWYHPRVVEWRDALLQSSQKCSCKFANNCRSCPVYDVTGCKKIA